VGTASERIAELIQGWNQEALSSLAGCGFNRSMQHLTFHQWEEDVADAKIPKESSLQRS
jgi:hypothetical protein